MTRTPDRCPTHPGEVLREDVIPATGKPKAEIARMLGISRQHLHNCFYFFLVFQLGLPLKKMRGQMLEIRFLF